MRLLPISVSLAAIFAASAASSADVLTSHFINVPGKPCYARTYDAEHLRKNPRQMVRRIEVDFDRRNADGKPNTSPQKFELGFAFQLKKGTDWYTGNAICAVKGDRIGCFLEGDGGEFTLRASGKSLRLDADKFGLHLEGAKDFGEIGGDISDDNVFILPAAPRAQCDASTADVR